MEKNIRVDNDLNNFLISSNNKNFNELYNSINYIKFQIFF